MKTKSPRLLMRAGAPFVSSVAVQKGSECVMKMIISHNRSTLSQNG